MAELHNIKPGDSELSNLIDRVEGASEPSREFDAELANYFGWYSPWPITSSLDAALALVREKLPGWAWSVTSSTFEVHFHAVLWTRAEPQQSAQAATPPLAILAALLRALKQERPRP